MIQKVIRVKLGTYVIKFLGVKIIKLDDFVCIGRMSRVAKYLFGAIIGFYGPCV